MTRSTSIKFGGLLIIATIILSHTTIRAQETNNEKTYHFNGDLSVTNNGFSFIPTFSLGDPAAILNLDVGGEGRLSFVPQFRYSLMDYRPWSIIGIWRYKIMDQGKFNVKLGTHVPALAFTYEDAISTNGDSIEFTKIRVQRFLPLEVLLGYDVSGHLSLGVYYLGGKGLEDADQLDRSDFLSLSASVKNLRLTENLKFKWVPQVFYLRIDDVAGHYTTHSFTLSHENIPFEINSMMNIELDSEIETKEFDWNISLVYRFKNEFVKRR